ncbi:MAG: sugar kinase [Clostridiales bacterium]|nr:sugar kinase [Clostridiales bacterium]
MKSVLCFGDICPDLIIPYGTAVEARSHADIDPALLAVCLEHGGSVANTSVGLRRQSLPVSFCGTVGNDGYGRMLYDGLAGEGVDVSLFRKDEGCTTVLVLIVLDQTGERFTFACPRNHASQHQILPSQIPEGIENHISWLHSSGITLREDPAASVQIDLMRRCFAAGVPVSLDINVRLETALDPDFAGNLQAALPYCHYLLGSGEDEIAPLAGIDDVEKAARSLVTPTRAVISRLGGRGATVYSADGETHQSGFPVTVSDAVGAGDAYNAGFIAARLFGRSLAESNRHACATAAICVSRRGGRATPTPAEIESFLNQ